MGLRESDEQREINLKVRRLLHELAGDENVADPVARIRVATKVIAAAENYRFSAMDQARSHSVLWSVIGRAMDMTGQAAGRLFRAHGNVDQRPDNFPRPGGRKRRADGAAGS